jgi:hypothetical protein
VLGLRVILLMCDMRGRTVLSTKSAHAGQSIVSLHKLLPPEMKSTNTTKTTLLSDTLEAAFLQHEPDFAPYLFRYPVRPDSWT